MVTLAEAVVEASDPVRVALVVVIAPVCPWTRMLTAVPVGMLVPESVTATGFVVVDGNVTSGLANDAAGVAGVATPPTVAMVRVGAFVSVAVVGDATEGDACPW